MVLIDGDTYMTMLLCRRVIILSEPLVSRWNCLLECVRCRVDLIWLAMLC